MMVIVVISKSGDKITLYEFEICTNIKTHHTAPKTAIQHPLLNGSIL